MANQRAKNNKSAFGAKPQGVIPKNEKTGEVLVSLDEIQLDALDAPADGDVVFCQEIPSFSKIKSVRVLNLEGIADGDISVGLSSNLELGDKEEVVVADPVAILASTPLSAIVEEHVMPVTAAGFLVERDRPVFLTVTLDTVPTLVDAKKIQVLVEVVGK